MDIKVKLEELYQQKAELETQGEKLQEEAMITQNKIGTMNNEYQRLLGEIKAYESMRP